MEQVFLGLGGNIGDVKATFVAALDQISLLPQITHFQVSKLYRTSPVGVPGDQPDYLNCVCGFLCGLPPKVLFAHLQEIEKKLGRTRAIPLAPRSIDIDLLLYGKQKIQEK